MSLNQHEYATIAEPGLHPEAVTLYIRCFRRFMNYKDGLVYISMARMISEMEYRPDPRSKDKPHSPTKQRIRTLISHLEKHQLIAKVKAGNINTGMAATWVCLMATNDQKKALICSNQQQHDSNTVHQHAQQHAQQHGTTQVNQGIESEQQHAHQHAQQHDTPSAQQHITDTTDTITNKAKSKKAPIGTRYKGFDLVAFEDSQIEKEAIKHLIDHRISKKTSQTQRALKLQIDKAQKAAEVGMTPEQLIDFTIDKDWKAINIEYTKNAIGANNYATQQLIKTNSNTYKKQPGNANGLFDDPNANVNALLQGN